MSTRAIVEVIDERETWRLYCHGDGYPDYLGRILLDICNELAQIDTNCSDVKSKATLDDVRCPVWPKLWVPNVASEACKTVAVIAGVLWRRGYHGVYLTTRDPDKEVAEDGTDIEHLYRVNVSNRYLPVISWWTINCDRERFYHHSDESFREKAGFEEDKSGRDMD